MYLSEHDIEKIVESYCNEFCLHLSMKIVKMDFPSDKDEKNYYCIYIDDTGINVTIYSDGRFKFKKFVGTMFYLESPDFSDIIHAGHFDYLYRKFRDTAKALADC